MMNKCPHCNRLNFKNRLSRDVNVFKCKNCGNKYSSKLNKIKFIVVNIMLCFIFFIVKLNNNELSVSMLSTFIIFTLISFISYLVSEEYRKIE